MLEKSVSFSKTITRTSISKDWRLQLPKEFCAAHLPCHNNDVILVDETEQEYTVKFLMIKYRLSSGWRDFVIEHGLQEGDILSFHLIDHCKFKVHITRANILAENEFQNNVPVGFMKAEDLAEEYTCFGNTATKQHIVSCAGDSHQKDRMLHQSKKRVHEDVVSNEKVYIKSRSTGTTGADHLSPHDDGHTRIVEKEFPAVNVNDHTLLEAGYDSTPLASQSVNVAYSESAIGFKCFEDFKIQVNGKAIDSEIPQDVRMKYYQLCCCQKKLIHNRVVKGLNSKFAAAVILEIVRIADSTKAATILTSPHDLECMEKTLQYFEDLGFAVGSLHAKIGKLTTFSTQHQTIGETTIAMPEIQREMAAFQEKKSKINEFIESKMAQYGELVEKLKTNIDYLKERREKLRFVFNKVARLTW